MEAKIKTGLFIVLFSVFFLPLVQKAIPLIKSKPLNGEYIIAPDTSFSWHGWLSGRYWEKKSKYINDNVGLRPDLIRLNNEIDYTLFKKIHSEWRLLGDNDCVFQDMYIYSYLGRDYDGYPFISEKVRKLRAIQDTLAHLGKSLIFVQSPCKAFFYPEFFPAEFKNMTRGTTNYETYKRLFDSAGVNQVDFNQWFLAMKGRSTELLYPKGGFHWSVYGALLAGDSLIKYIENLRQIKMVHPTWTDIVRTNVPRGKDDDISRSMNMIFPLAKETYSYPLVKYEGEKTAVKPNVIYIGDSFLFQWMDEGLMEQTNRKWQIWYYTSSLVDKTHENSDPGYSLENVDIFGELSQADVVVVMYTSRNLSKLGKSFIEKLYAHYYPRGSSPQ